MAIEKREFANRAARYPLKPFHNKEVIYSTTELGSHKATDFLDISSTGIAFITEQELTPKNGSIVRLTFSVPGQNSMTIKAQVVRTTPYKRPEWYKRYYDDKGKKISESFVAVNFLNLTELKKDELEVHLLKLIESEKKERLQRAFTYIKDGFLKSYKWIGLSFLALALLTISLKLYFD